MLVDAKLEAVKGWRIDCRGHEIVPRRSNSIVKEVHRRRAIG